MCWLQTNKGSWIASKLLLSGQWVIWPIAFQRFSTRFVKECLWEDFDRSWNVSSWRDFGSCEISSKIPMHFLLQWLSDRLSDCSHLRAALLMASYCAEQLLGSLLAPVSPHSRKLFGPFGDQSPKKLVTSHQKKGDIRHQGLTEPLKLRENMEATETQKAKKYLIISCTSKMQTYQITGKYTYPMLPLAMNETSLFADPLLFRQMPQNKAFESQLSQVARMMVAWWGRKTPAASIWHLSNEHCDMTQGVLWNS